MPTYEYECGSCGVFEQFQSIKDDALKRCPHCQGRKIRRLISGGGGVIFKGDGFWETDYNRSDDYRKQAKSETGKTTKSSAADDGKAAQPAQETTAGAKSGSTGDKAKAGTGAK